MSDNWAHRRENMKCKTCMWFCPKRPNPAAPAGAPASPAVVDVGRCRRRAPTMGGYPVVFVNDWCGDHKLNENAL